MAEHNDRQPSTPGNSSELSGERSRRMAKLDTEHRGDVLADVQRRLSAERIVIPATKPQMAAVINAMDDGLESAEASIVNSLAPDAKSWLTANQRAARRLLQRVAEVRQENL